MKNPYKKVSITLEFPTEESYASVWPILQLLLETTFKPSKSDNSNKPSKSDNSK